MIFSAYSHFYLPHFPLNFHHMIQGMRCKFGASELRLNMLDTFLPLEYPVTVYRDVWDARQVRHYLIYTAVHLYCILL